MIIQDITSFLEKIAPKFLQESYDNAGLITGQLHWKCTGVLICLDALENVVQEAIEKKCNLVISHHPIVFGGLKSFTGKNYVEKSIISAIKNDVAIFAIHTNLDNVLYGVNGKIADILGLINRQVLLPKNNSLKKLYTFVPLAYAEKVRNAIFEVGTGQISNYSECSFNTQGEATFKPNDGANPFLGKIGERHTEEEIRIEVVFHSWQQNKILEALFAEHPYEEVAYDIMPLENTTTILGSGLVGELPRELEIMSFLKEIKEKFNLSVIKHTGLCKKTVQKVAICGGAGSFLIPAAIAFQADIFISSDIKYHEFFDANGKLIIADIGHYESEQFTIALLFDILTEKFPTFAIQKTGLKTNPVHYFL